MLSCFLFLQRIEYLVGWENQKLQLISQNCSHVLCYNGSWGEFISWVRKTIGVVLSYRYTFGCSAVLHLIEDLENRHRFTLDIFHYIFISIRWNSSLHNFRQCSFPFSQSSLSKMTSKNIYQWSNWILIRCLVVCNNASWPTSVEFCPTIFHFVLQCLFAHGQCYQTWFLSCGHVILLMEAFHIII